MLSMPCLPCLFRRFISRAVELFLLQFAKPFLSSSFRFVVKGGVMANTQFRYIRLYSYKKENIKQHTVGSIDESLNTTLCKCYTCIFIYLPCGRGFSFLPRETSRASQRLTQPTLYSPHHSLLCCTARGIPHHLRGGCVRSLSPFPPLQTSA